MRDTIKINKNKYILTLLVNVLTVTVIKKKKNRK